MDPESPPPRCILQSHFSKPGSALPRSISICANKVLRITSTIVGRGPKPGANWLRIADEPPVLTRAEGNSLELNRAQVVHEFFGSDQRNRAQSRRRCDRYARRRHIFDASCPFDGRHACEPGSVVRVSLARFALLSALALLVLGVGIRAAGRHIAEEQALDEATDRATGVGTGTVYALVDRGLRAGDRFDERVDRPSPTGWMTAPAHAVIFDAHGLVLWSDVDKLVGTPVPDRRRAGGCAPYGQGDTAAARRQGPSPRRQRDVHLQQGKFSSMPAG